jgi:hypothetical protein
MNTVNPCNSTLRQAMLLKIIEKLVLLFTIRLYLNGDIVKPGNMFDKALTDPRSLLLGAVDEESH